MGRDPRATCGSGLTSPKPVRTPTAPAATQNPVPEPGTRDKPHSRRAAGRSRPESACETPRAGIKPENGHRNWPVDRGLVAIWDDQLRAWVSDVQVAEVPHTAFTSTKGQVVTAC